jgi:hypothetical protein
MTDPVISSAAASRPSPGAPEAFVERAPNMRSFSLNSAEGEAALRVPRPSWVWAGGLPPEPRRPRGPEGASVSADTQDAATEALADWLGHLDSGRIPIRYPRKATCPVSP